MSCNNKRKNEHEREGVQLTLELTTGVEIAAWKFSLSSACLFNVPLVDASSLET